MFAYFWHFFSALLHWFASNHLSMSKEAGRKASHTLACLKEANCFVSLVRKEICNDLPYSVILSGKEKTACQNRARQLSYNVPYKAVPMLIKGRMFQILPTLIHLLIFHHCRSCSQWAHNAYLSDEVFQEKFLKGTSSPPTSVPKCVLNQPTKNFPCPIYRKMIWWR